ncbi:toxin HicA [uncultured Dysosmobacter sp.]|uniref:toxin HicA n=1 Tax=uncultured Dysosmobacter sp. TaxID=2591384 RepID=UPI00260BC632|nr:toxin HicA [uncultured Dysosmobacter sp.]
MSKWDKLVTAILEKSPNLRFDDLCKALESIGYQREQPRGDSSHYTFRKSGCMPITLPKQSPMNRAYIKLVAEAVQQYLESEE